MTSNSRRSVAVNTSSQGICIEDLNGNVSGIAGAPILGLCASSELKFFQCLQIPVLGNASRPLEALGILEALRAR